MQQALAREDWPALVEALYRWLDYSDDPRYFVTFTPSPLPRADGTPSAPNENISPFASAIVRFTKPVDLATVRPFDTFFIATRDLLDPAVEQAFMAEHGLRP